MGLLRDAMGGMAAAIHAQFGWRVHSYDGQVYEPSVSDSRTIVNVKLPDVGFPAPSYQLDGGLHGTGSVTVDVYNRSRAAAIDASENVMRWLHLRSFGEGASFFEVVGWMETEREEIDGFVGGTGWHAMRISGTLRLAFAPQLTREEIFGEDFTPIVFRFTPTDAGNAAAVMALPAVAYAELYSDVVDVTGGNPTLTGAFAPPLRFTSFGWHENAAVGGVRQASFEVTLSGAEGYTANAIGLYNSDGDLIAAASAYDLIVKPPDIIRTALATVSFDDTDFQHSGELELDGRALELGGRGLRVD